MSIPKIIQQNFNIYIHREISFELNLRNCDPLDNFDEGVELSVSNLARDGHWIPLHYFVGNEGSHPESLPAGQVNRGEYTIKIRGYTVPYKVQSSSQEKLDMSVHVCRDVLREGLQIRWLQNTRMINNRLRDLVTLDNASIRFPGCSEKYSFLNGERYVS